MQTHAWLPALLLTCAVHAATQADAPTTVGVPVSYQLPTDGPLPKTYRVTLAATDPKNPDWIVSTFVRGEVRTVTAENQGKFTDTWDGLDENLMPIPPGSYGLKGIYMNAEKWRVDGEYHTIVPQFLGGGSSWLPTPEQDMQREPFGGDPCNSPLRAVAVGPKGVGTFYWQYMENGTNSPLIDFNKPIGVGQVLAAYNSGGAAGGIATATDGVTIWDCCSNSDTLFIHRADEKPFGTQRARGRQKIYLPRGAVTGMAAVTDAKAGKSFVYVSMKGAVNEVVVLDGQNAAELAHLPADAPQAVMVRDGKMTVLHHDTAGQWIIGDVALKDGLPAGALVQRFVLPAEIHPFDCQSDSHGNFYISDPEANAVYKLGPDGKQLLVIGHGEQKPGSYDPLALMHPEKLATWTDADGKDRLIIIEMYGPNRASEWSSDGKLLRQWITPQTEANQGYAVDPEDPEHIYMLGQTGWLDRFKIDYTTGAWTVDAVWPNVGSDPEAPGLVRPRCFHINGRMYLASGRNYTIYRLEGDRWLLSAAIIQKRTKNVREAWLWNDVNGDGKVQEDEYKSHPTTVPPGCLRYFGEMWENDLSLLALQENHYDAWRLSPTGFDARGIPQFADSHWEKFITDPVMQARADGKADALFGANELTDTFNSAWGMIDGTREAGYYLYARGGINFSANQGAQEKLSRYVPDGHGGYTIKWRVGRTALQGVAQHGEIYSGIFVTRPTRGLVGVSDNSLAGYVLYTEDGMYVETLFPDGRRFPRSVAGIYPQPGEFFQGYHYLNKNNGKIYIAMGKIEPQIFEARGWGEAVTHPILTIDKSVSLSASQIATPPEAVRILKGEKGSGARLAGFEPSPGGGPALDGSMTGWETSDPVKFQADKDQTVEVRCAYDPDHLYLRWHARLGSKFEPKPLQPVERLFTHDRLADTLSFYIQGDSAARPGSADGRPGDVRIIFGLFGDAGAVRPVALGMYPKWYDTAQKPAPFTYISPVGRVNFEHVGLLADAKLGSALDPDGKGFVIAASIPRAALPLLPAFSDQLRTLVNFEATLGGHNKFWWSNADRSASRETYDEPTESRLYPGSWSPAQFTRLGDSLLVRGWLACGPWGGPGAETFSWDLHGPDKDRAKKFFAAAQYPPDDFHVDPAASFTGPLTQGYWPKPGAVRWKPMVVPPGLTALPLAKAGETWYAASWVRVPEDMTLDCSFLTGKQNTDSFWVNGKEIPKEKHPDGATPPEKPVPVRFKQGWNQVYFRGFCVGYDLCCGLILHGTPEQLWAVELSQTPR